MAVTTEGGVACLICGTVFRRLTPRHLITHSTTAGEYRRRFGVIDKAPKEESARRDAGTRLGGDLALYIAAYAERRRSVRRLLRPRTRPTAMEDVLGDLRRAAQRTNGHHPAVDGAPTPKSKGASTARQ